ncbi:MAG: HDIG domain-containing protein [Methanomassiliicoccales archaeon]|nr:HDIG domain-containing protein [Methanomassiliicoccales archaeon]
MSAIPSEEECIQILKDEGCNRSIIKHCCMVLLISVKIAERCKVDMNLVKAGALLHDVGRSRTQGILHSVAGADIAKSRGLPEELVRIIRRHLGAGLTWDEAKALGLPRATYMPETLEEKIVTHADNLVGDTNVRTLEESARDFEDHGLAIAAERMRVMHAELSKACGIDIDEIVAGLKPRGKIKGPCGAYVSRSDRRP